MKTWVFGLFLTLFVLPLSSTETQFYSGFDFILSEFDNAHGRIVTEAVLDEWLHFNPDSVVTHKSYFSFQTNPFVFPNAEAVNISHSYGALAFNNTATTQYEGGLLYVAAQGGNSPTRVNKYARGPIVSTAHSDSAGVNFSTAFGRGMTFVNPTPECNCQSYSNPRIMSKLGTIKRKLQDARQDSVSWNEVVYRAKATAIQTPESHNRLNSAYSTETYPMRRYNEHNGYGMVDVDAAVNFLGEIPTLAPHQELGLSELGPWPLLAIDTLVRLASNGTPSWTQVNDSTYQTSSAVTIFADLTGNNFNPINIVGGMKMFTGIGQMYRIDSIWSKTFSSFECRVVQLTDTNVAPTGQCLFFNSTTESIPSIPVGSTGMTQQLLSAVVSWNSQIEQDIPEAEPELFQGVTNYEATLQDGFTYKGLRQVVGSKELFMGFNLDEAGAVLLAYDENTSDFIRLTFNAQSFNLSGNGGDGFAFNGENISFQPPYLPEYEVINSNVDQLLSFAYKQNTLAPVAKTLSSISLPSSTNLEQPREFIFEGWTGTSGERHSLTIQGLAEIKLGDTTGTYTLAQLNSSLATLLPQGPVSIDADGNNLTFDNLPIFRATNLDPDALVKHEFQSSSYVDQAHIWRRDEFGYDEVKIEMDDGVMTLEDESGTHTLASLSASILNNLPQAPVNIDATGNNLTFDNLSLFRIRNLDTTATVTHELFNSSNSVIPHRWARYQDGDTVKVEMQYGRMTLKDTSGAHLLTDLAVKPRAELFKASTVISDTATNTTITGFSLTNIKGFELSGDTAMVWAREDTLTLQVSISADLEVDVSADDVEFKISLFANNTLVAKSTLHDRFNFNAAGTPRRSVSRTFLLEIKPDDALTVKYTTDGDSATIRNLTIVAAQ